MAADDVTAPLPVESATLTDALAGRDVAGRAQTGGGKTIAFAVPAVKALWSNFDERPTTFSFVQDPNTGNVLRRPVCGVDTNDPRAPGYYLANGDKPKSLGS